MNLICLLMHHNWQFSYNHGMPQGISLDDSLKMFKGGKTFGVYVCTRCGRQARLVDGEMVMLPRSQVEIP